MTDLWAKRRQMADLPVPVFPAGTETADLIAGGRPFYKVYRRTIPYDFYLGVGEMEEMAVSSDIEVAAGATEAHVQLPAPLATLKPREGIHRRCEVNLLFESHVPRQPLLLTDEPALRLVERARARRSDHEMTGNLQPPRLSRSVTNRSGFAGRRTVQEATEVSLGRG